MTFTGPQDGVEATIIGVHSNRDFEISYGPGAFIEQQSEIPTEPSLFDYQLKQRKK